MGQKITEIYAELTGKDAGFKAAVGGAKSLTESAKGAFGGMANSAGSLITRLIGVAAAYSTVKKIIGEFAESETAINNLAAAFRLSGNQSTFAVGKAREFADAIMAVTTHSDEAVLAAMRFGSTVGRLSGEGLEQATHAAVGLAAALGIDLEQAMKFLIRAKNGNTTALQRLGVHLDENLTKQEKYAAVLKIGNDGFELATAQTNTLAGAWAQLGNAASELAEDTGGVLGGSLMFLIGVAKDTIDMIRELKGAFGEPTNADVNAGALEAFSKLSLDDQIEKHNKLNDIIAEGTATDSMLEMYAEQTKIMNARVADEKKAAKETEDADKKAAVKAEEHAGKVRDLDHEIAVDMLDDEEKKREAVDETARKRIENAEKLYKTDEDLSYALLAIEEARQRGMDKIAADALEKRREARDKELEEDAKAAEQRAGALEKAQEKTAGAAERLAGLKAERARPQVFSGGDLSRRIQEGVGSEQKKAIILAEKQLKKAEDAEKQRTKTNQLLELIEKAGQPFTWV